MNAPAPIIVFVPYEIGSPKRLREVKPPAYPQRRDQRWPLNQTIPGPTRRELQQEVQRALEHSKPQREALLRRSPPSFRRRALSG
jgi:hypothetical protein